MSHNLTQPEEIDLVWALANHDVEEDLPIPEWAQSSRTMRNAERPESARRTTYDYMVS